MAEIRRITTGSTLSTPIPFEMVLREITHLLRKPPIGGIPTRDRDAARKQHMTTGICFPIPTRSSTLLLPIL